ncbi:MAG: hypothetical protein NTY02_18935 [Acidobacteria bacterium]|nr:hypothetical protein [Acidobacteriota bacterium]
MKKWFLYGLSAVMATAIACGGDSKTPVSPSSVTNATADAAADGSTLKATAPDLVSPADGARVSNKTPSLVATYATLKFGGTATFTYRFQVRTQADALIDEAVEPQGSNGGTAHVIPASVSLANDTTYKWRARAETSAGVGPWSGYITFITPNSPSAIASYQTATTLWDNLTDLKTIGSALNMEFNAGKGARTISTESYIRYIMLQTLTAGEMSFYVDNFNPLSAGSKTKFSSQYAGTGDITTDPWRFTLEKRGALYGSPQVRTRIITGSGIFDGGPVIPSLDKTKTYFIKYTWGSGRITIVFFEADPVTGTLGKNALTFSASYSGTYRPSPHWICIGAPVGRGGSDDGSVPNMTVRWVWISDGNTSRPAMLPGDLRATAGDGPGF